MGPFNFSDAPIRTEWAFDNLTFAETHAGPFGYHSYPMRFVPQFAERLVLEYSRAGGTVCDPFMGSGTVLAESTLHGRNAVGVDANPLCPLICGCVSSPLDPAGVSLLVASLQAAIAGLENFAPQTHPAEVEERLLFWHPRQQYDDLSRMLTAICTVADVDLRRFALVAFSHVLKQCSLWSSGSTRAIRSDKRRRKPQNPRIAFLRHLRMMEKRNAEWWTHHHPATLGQLSVETGDARCLPYGDQSVDAVITSPPYVTSYDYAELHQLSLLWLGYVNSYQELRPTLIGSQYGVKEVLDSGTPQLPDIVLQTLEQLRGATKHQYLVRAVRAYFLDMVMACQEVVRVLKPDGRAVVVIGNTRLRKVDIRNAEVIAEVLVSHGLELIEVMRRPIPVKSIPQERNPATGQFITGQGENAYSTEYIIVCGKPSSPKG